MEVGAVVLAVDELWQELPGLLGDEWLSFYPRLRTLLEDTSQQEPDAEATRRAAEILRCIDSPAARERLRGAAGRLLEDHRGVGGVAWGSARHQLVQRLCAPEVTRYVEVEAPPYLLAGHPAQVVVCLRQQLALATHEPVRLAVSHNVTVRLAPALGHRGAFDMEGSAEQDLQVPPDGDSPPAVFEIRSDLPGEHRADVELWQEERLLAIVPWRFATLPGGHAAPQLPGAPLRSEVRLEGPYAAPVDLEIWVTVEGRQLQYQVNSPSGRIPVKKPIRGPLLAGDPETYSRHLHRRLQDLRAGRDGRSMALAPEQVRKRLVAIGRELFRDLFASELGVLYREHADAIGSIEILSEEPWIPWELIHPDEEIAPGRPCDGFLCCRHRFGRWLLGTVPETHHLRVRRSALVEAPVVPGQVKLPAVVSECRRVSELLRSRGVEGVQAVPLELGTLHELLDRSEVGLWHFAGHGDWMAGEEPAFLLPDDNAFQPSDLSGRQARALVVFNACHSGRQDLSLGGVSGWAAAWIRSHCAGFLAPLWAVRDHVAERFATSFYQHLAGDIPLGEAVRQARLEGLQQPGFDPLAYRLFGHPHATVRLGSGGSPR